MAKQVLAILKAHACRAQSAPKRVLQVVHPDLLQPSRGKHVRAEPIALLYEQGKVRHVGAFPELEDQLCAMRPDGYAGAGSPDRLDALVWALTELSGPPKIGIIVGGGRSYAGW